MPNNKMKTIITCENLDNEDKKTVQGKIKDINDKIQETLETIEELPTKQQTSAKQLKQHIRMNCRKVQQGFDLKELCDLFKLTKALLKRHPTGKTKVDKGFANITDNKVEDILDPIIWGSGLSMGSMSPVMEGLNIGTHDIKELCSHVCSIMRNSTDIYLLINQADED